MIGILEMFRPSAIWSGMLAPAMRSTTAMKRPVLRYRKSPMITAMPRKATSVARLTPSVSSTYSSGRLAITAVIRMRPMSTISRMRMRVRKSSPSFLFSAIYPSPWSGILKPRGGAGKRDNTSHDVESVCQGRRRGAGGTRSRRAAIAADRKKLHHACRLRAAGSRAAQARRSRAAGSGEDRGVGGFARRPLGERRLHLWQAPPARDRPARALPHQAAGERGSRALGGPRDGSGVFRGDGPRKERVRRKNRDHRRRGRGRPGERPGVVDLAHRKSAAQGARRRHRHAAHPRGRGAARDPGGHLPMSFIREFREFAMKGNIVDLAIAVVIGGAFGKIVASLVEDIVMPAIGAIGRVEFKDLMVQVGDAKILYGKFIQTCVDFMIIALAIFVAVKLLNNFRRKEEAKAPPRQEQLLEEIRDLLKRR